MPTDPIRIRITPRESVLAERDAREAFWTAARRETESNQTIASSEAKLCREFGIELRRRLLRELAEPIHILDSELFPGSLRDFEHWMFRFMDGPSSERERYRYQFVEAFSRLLEQRQQVLRESPSLRGVQERLAAAAGITFSTRIAGYSSLNLDLWPGSFKQLAKAFENDFDSFRVFLEAFVPAAFAGVFAQDNADKLNFAVTIPASAEQVFRAATIDTPLPQMAQAAPPGVAGSPGTARERAEWLWRLANGSLIIPVLLALLVLYQGMKMLSDIRATQYEALKPILEHQLKLLEEDRHRLLRDAASPTPMPPAPTPATTPTPPVK
jgi:hypothetical protein